MINNTKVFCWFLILVFVIFVVFYPVMIRVTRHNGPHTINAVLVERRSLLSRSGDLTEIKCKEMIMPELSDGELSIGDPNSMLRPNYISNITVFNLSRI